MKLMYDSVTAADIPADAQIVAGYVDGRYAWSESDWARFPNATKVRIAVFPWTNDGDVLDVEPGDAEPSQAPSWIRMRQADGLARPTIYCSLGDMSAVEAYCRGLEYDIWSAHYTGVPHIDSGAVATQYANPTMGSGGHYDLTLCSDAWPRVAVTAARETPADWEWPTYYEAAVNLKAIADMLGERAVVAEAKLAQIRDLAA